MKIKHWQGYGCVDAKKVSKKSKNGSTTLIVMVRGNHEWGLVRDDKYDLKRWLVDRFDKGAKDVSPYDIKVTHQDGYIKADNGCDEEFCKYTFIY